VHENQSIWILIAHRVEARIYLCHRYDKKLILVETLNNPSGRLKNTDLDSDAPGHTKDRFGPGKHAMEPKHDSASQNQWDFSKTIAEFVESGRLDSKFQSLILVAGADMLGDLRKNLGEQSAKLILASYSKDLFGAESHDHSKFEATLKELIADNF